jgi:hypothetical protein
MTTNDTNFTYSPLRGFKSHPVRRYNDNKLSGQCSKNVTQQTAGEAEKAREVMALVRGLSAQKTAWLWGAR